MVMAGGSEGFAGPEGLSSLLKYLVCFNRGAYHSAHDVLEALWLPRRGAAEADFYKALIQLAGAFHHLQKGRARPALSLFRRIRELLQGYPAVYGRLEVSRVVDLATEWISLLESGAAFDLEVRPQLGLAPG